MELRAARAAARRRVGAYTAIVTAVGFAWLVLAVPAAARVAGGDPGPVCCCWPPSSWPPS